MNWFFGATIIKRFLRVISVFFSNTSSPLPTALHVVWVRERQLNPGDPLGNTCYDVLSQAQPLIHDNVELLLQKAA